MERVPAIAVLMACFNRRETTLRCLRHLHEQTMRVPARFEYYVMDDGSSDGTMAAVLAEFPSVTVLRGDGSLYWCGGMRAAWKVAARGDPDMYLCVNDDTFLFPDCVGSLLEMVGSSEALMIGVAAICDGESGEATYGGQINTTKMHGLAPLGEQDCHTFNCNCALVPRAVYQRIGMFHEAYVHGLGDYDYGITARRAGIKIVQSNHFLGTCSINPLAGTWRDTTLGRLDRFRLLQQSKGLPWALWLIYLRRTAGWMWPVHFIKPYLRILLGM